MDRLSSVVKSRFKKNWKQIVCQIVAVNDACNPKRGFLFDCGAGDVGKLTQLLQELKCESLINNKIVLVVVHEDIFILNPHKFEDEIPPVVVDVSGSLEVPRKFACDVVTSMFEEVKKQIRSSTAGLIKLEIAENWSVPTIFGYLINYPVLYFLNPNDDANNLCSVELQVYQITSDDQTLISFSVPKAIIDQDEDVQQSITSWLLHFQSHADFKIKMFTATHPVVVL